MQQRRGGTPAFEEQDDVDTAAADRSLFSEFSIGASRVHVPVKMVNMRTLRGLDGHKVKGLKLESLKSKVTRTGERKSIRSFNMKLAQAIKIASKIGQTDPVDKREYQND